MPDNVKALLDAFWSAGGWRTPPGPPDEGAIEAGLMFREPLRLGHDEWVARARAAVRALTAADVGAAFAGSLASRRLDLRSALGSYAVARHLPEHPFEGEKACRVCGLPAELEQDLNVFSFERFKWGGVRHDEIAYAAFDLEQFAPAPREEVPADAGRALVAALRDVPPQDTAPKVAAGLKSVKGNKAEREVVLDILGLCGVLETADHPGHRRAFIRHDDRPLPDHHFTDRAYPVCWWRGSDGVGEAALAEFFPHLAAPAPVVT